MGSSGRAGKAPRERDASLESEAETAPAPAFPATVHAQDSWTEKAGGKEVDSVETGCWRGAPRTPWTSRKTDTWALAQIQSETSLGAE